MDYMRIHSNRAVAPVIATILMVAIVVILAGVVGIYFGSSGTDIEQSPNVAISAQLVEPLSDDCDDEVRLTHNGGDPIRAENLLLVTDQEVDIGSASGTPPNCPDYSTTRERVTEGEDQAGIGEAWTAGESFRFGSNNLDGTSVKLVWNPERVADAGTDPNSDFGEINSDTAYILYEETF